MKGFETQFNAIKPEAVPDKKKKGGNSVETENIKETAEGELVPLQETEESVFFLGVETAKGLG
ncbi:MAG: hypothetical protein WCO10_03830, partial [bacterium]